MEKTNLPVSRDTRVTVDLIDSNGGVERREFTLVASEQADFKSGLLDENAPLGRTLTGHFAGQTIPYRQGDLRQVRILAVEKAEAASDEAAEQRRADVRSAEAQSEITSQMIFASARGSKWGEYDVDLDKLLEEEQKKKDKKKQDDEESNA
jgi:hypothetical protein